jgi:riboflavin kinase
MGYGGWRGANEMI